MPTERSRARGTLPRALREFFWDCDFECLRWGTDRDFVIERLLERGDLRAMRWLRKRVSDGELRVWIESRGGRGLSPRRLRYWELVLSLRHPTVSRWIAAQQNLPWARRLSA